jgi:hypothetical protein
MADLLSCWIKLDQSSKINQTEVVNMKTRVSSAEWRTLDVNKRKLDVETSGGIYIEMFYDMGFFAMLIPIALLTRCNSRCSNARNGND